MVKEYILRCKLSSGLITKEEVPDNIISEYIGGRGLGVKYFSDEVNPKVDPLSKENKMIFAVGPLTGSPAPTSGRCSCITKSPLTHTIFDSNSGGRFGAELRSLNILAI